MPEIEIPSGKIRELEEYDIEAISTLSGERDILERFYIDRIDDYRAYWRKKLDDQLWYREHGQGVVRATYALPIEVHNQVIGLMNINVEPYSCRVGEYPNEDVVHTSEVSYFIGCDHRRSGIAESALRATIPYVFQNVDAAIIRAVTLIENVPSQNLLEKIGFKKMWEGIKDSSPGKGRNVIVYRLSRKLQEKSFCKP